MAYFFPDTVLSIVGYLLSTHNNSRVLIIICHQLVVYMFCHQLVDSVYQVFYILNDFLCTFSIND